jgi:CHAD domain-containing protein
MAYRFKAKESIPDGVKRLASAQIGGALEALTGRGHSHEEQAHEVRKRIKKVRALLRLVESERTGSFNSEHARLREAGQKLAPFRDAAALIVSFDALRDKYPDKAQGLDTVREGLLAHKRRFESHQTFRRVLDEVAAELAGIGKKVKGWKLDEDGFSAIARGAERTIIRGRKSMAQACKTRQAEDFHDWRKRVKDHWYHLRLLHDLWPDVMQGYEDSLRTLESILGRDHDLTLLADKTPRNHALRRTVHHFQDELRAEAEPLGIRIYGGKPSHLMRQLEQWWSIWKPTD